jgi:hypothetical protein
MRNPEKLSNAEGSIDIRDEDDINEIIQSAPSLSTTSERAAPFLEYTENNQESWKYVTPQEVEEYLSAKLFFDTSIIPRDSLKELAEVRANSPHEGIKVPLDLVVNATGFEDWRGRPEGVEKQWSVKSGNERISGTMDSLNVIKMYAGTPSKLPAAGVMQMYIQPNRKVFFDNYNGDSHRIAAAILRGENDIEANCVIVYQIDTDYL